MHFIFFKAVLKMWFDEKHKRMPEDDFASALPGFVEISAIRREI